jgi:hypothetical protein
MVQWQTNLANGRLVMPNADFPQEQLMVWLVNVGTADLLMHNARINCGVNLATFLRLLAKKATSLRSQISCVCYNFICHMICKMKEFH